MNEKIIERMTEIVESTMTSNKSDFYKYDKPYFEKANLDDTPELWIVGELHTYNLWLGTFEEEFNNNEIIRWEYVGGVNSASSTLNYSERNWKDDKVFLVTSDEVRQINHKQAKEVLRDVMTPVVVKWKEKNGPLPKPRHVDVKFHNITLSQLRGLFKDCEAHGDRSLTNILRRFHKYTRIASDHVIDVFYRKEDNEFTFVECVNGDDRLVGGIIFHGWPETGYLANYAVQIDPDYGWSMHT